MGYLAAWKVLEEMVACFREKGIIIPRHVVEDLKSAKTMIRVLKADPSYEGTIQKVEGYLANVESFLALEGEVQFGAEHVNEWLRGLDEARRKSDGEDQEETRFVAGLPRGAKWVRVKPSDELPLEELREFAEESRLSHRVQSDGFVLVFGKDKDVKSFVRKTATRRASRSPK